MPFSPDYVRIVLNDNFEDAKTLFLDPLMAIHYAHLVMLHDTGIVSLDDARTIRRALDGIDLAAVRGAKLWKSLPALMLGFVADMVNCCTGAGKNVPRLPLCTCHLSHNRTKAKPNITHKIVRRMSFIGTSLVSLVRRRRRGQLAAKAVKTGGTHAAARSAPGHARLGTTAGSALAVTQSATTRHPRHAAPAPAARRRNRWARSGTNRPASG